MGHFQEWRGSYYELCWDNSINGDSLGRTVIQVTLLKLPAYFCFEKTHIVLVICTRFPQLG